MPPSQAGVSAVKAAIGHCLWPGAFLAWTVWPDTNQAALWAVRLLPLTIPGEPQSPIQESRTHLHPSSQGPRGQPSPCEPRQVPQNHSLQQRKCSCPGGGHALSYPHLHASINLLQLEGQTYLFPQIRPPGGPEQEPLSGICPQQAPSGGWGEMPGRGAGVSQGVEAGSPGQAWKASSHAK